MRLLVVVAILVVGCAQAARFFPEFTTAVRSKTNRNGAMLTSPTNHPNANLPPTYP
jgi:hypothetical protein